MNKQELITFINANYGDDELLIFQTISFKNIEPYTTGGKEHWEEFVEYEASYSVLADEYTNLAVDSFNDFANTPKENN